MKTLKTTLISLAITGSLGSSFAVLADTAKEKLFEGLVVEDIVLIEQLPSEVQSGSMRAKNDDDAAMVGQTKLTSSEAAEIAIMALPGKVIETKLDNENGYLIWEVEIINGKGNETKLMIDAGNGHLLAAESEEDEGFNWRFWEN